MAGKRRVAFRAQADHLKNARIPRRPILALDLGQHALLQVGILVGTHDGGAAGTHSQLPVRMGFGEVDVV